MLFTFDFFLYVLLFFFSRYCQPSQAHSGPALHCSSPFHFWDFLFLISCRLQFHHLEYFAYPKVIFLTSSIIQSTKQEPESKTSPWAAQTVAAASLVGHGICLHTQLWEGMCVGLHLHGCASYTLTPGRPLCPLHALGPAVHYYRWYLGN